MFRHLLVSCAFGVVLGLFSAPLSGQTFSHIEPPNWWAGMAADSMTVMFHGPGVGTWSIEIPEAPVSLRGIERVSSPNYLFVTLDLSAAFLEPGDTLEVALTFRDEKGKERARHDFPILGRTPAARYRQGYGNADALCLITPDRFANGNPANDNIRGMGDPVDRTDAHGRHGGDLAGIESHLDDLRDLGYTAVWLNPVLENRMPESSYHGYAITDFYAVDTRFGTNAEYVALADALRDREMKLVMDMILNHCGLEHWWLDDLPDPSWINHSEGFSPTNHLRTTLRDPHAADADRVAFSDGWFVPTMPDLNQRHPLLAQYLIQNAIWWVETLGLGGIRVDTYPYSDPEFLTEWTKALMTEYPRFSICGEEWSMNPAVLAYWQAGSLNRDRYVSWLPGLLDFPLQRACVEALTKESGWESVWLPLYETLSSDFLYARPEAHVIFPDNHDMSRIASQLGDDPALVQLALAFFATTRGTPTFYYGTEILMTNTGDNSHGNIRSDFPGGWPGDEVNGFTGEGLSEEALEMKDFFTRLLSWRRDSEAIARGSLKHFAPRDKEPVYVYVREGEEELVFVALNRGEDALNLPAARYVEALPSASKGWDVLEEREVAWDPEGEVEVPGKGVLIWSFKN